VPCAQTAHLAGFLEHPLTKQANADLDGYLEPYGQADGWRVGTMLREGKGAEETLGVVVRVVTKAEALRDEHHGRRKAWCWVSWEGGDFDAPGQQELHNARDSYRARYGDGFRDRAIGITCEQLAAHWCAIPLPAARHPLSRARAAPPRAGHDMGSRPVPWAVIVYQSARGCARARERGTRAPHRHAHD